VRRFLSGALSELAIEEVVLQKRDDGRAFASISIGS
jgi:hypothetical protein